MESTEKGGVNEPLFIITVDSGTVILGSGQLWLLKIPFA
jgi:hypothetical protein